MLIMEMEINEDKVILKINTFTEGRWSFNDTFHYTNGDLLFVLIIATIVTDSQDRKIKRQGKTDNNHYSSIRDGIRENYIIQCK